MSVSATPAPKMQFFDNNGNPLVGGKLYTYQAGTTLLQNTYSSASGAAYNTNPIILDSRGEATIFLDAKSYKFVLKTSADVLIWSVDNVNAVVQTAQLVTADGSAANPGVVIGANNSGFSAAAFGTVNLSISGTPYYSFASNSAVFTQPLYTNTGGLAPSVNGSNSFYNNTTSAITSSAFGGRAWSYSPSGVDAFAIDLDVAANAVKTFKYDGAAVTELSRMTTAGNLKIGGTASRATTEGTNQLVLFNGTAPVGTLANGISIYSSAGEAYVKDAAGNATLFSPHDKDTNEWIYYSVHTPTGKTLRIDMERIMRFINDHFGLDAVHEEN